MKYVFTKYSLRDLKKLPKNIQKRIVSKLDYFTSQKEPLSFAEHLSDSRIGSYRFRVGYYRITFDLVNHQMIIHAVGHRREIYK